MDVMCILQWVKLLHLKFTVVCFPNALLRFKLRFSAVLHAFLSAEGCGCLAEGRGTYVLIVVNTVPSRYSRYIFVSCGCRTAESRGLNRISVNVVLLSRTHVVLCNTVDIVSIIIIIMIYGSLRLQYFTATPHYNSLHPTLVKKTKFLRFFFWNSEHVQNYCRGFTNLI